MAGDLDIPQPDVAAKESTEAKEASCGLQAQHLASTHKKLFLLRAHLSDRLCRCWLNSSFASLALPLFLKREGCKKETRTPIWSHGLTELLTQKNPNDRLTLPSSFNLGENGALGKSLGLPGVHKGRPGPLNPSHLLSSVRDSKSKKEIQPVFKDVLFGLM